MQDEFAITDDQGQLFGLPAKTYTSQGAAERVLEHLNDRRREMQFDAEEAQKQLDDDVPRLLEDRDRLREAVARWQAESSRSYSIIKRQVSEWKAVA